MLTPLLAVVTPVGGPQNPGRWIITVRVRARQHQDVNNVAYVQSDIAFDPDTANNYAYVKHEITDVADLQVTKGDNPDPVTAGTTLTYTIRVTNNGVSDAENTILYDRLPPGIVLNSIVTSNGATCSTGTPGNPIDRVVCGLGTLRSTGPITTAVITITATVNKGLVDGTILENDVFVTSDVFDPYDGNNHANQLTTVTPRSLILVTKTDLPDPVVAGTMVEYRIRIQNNGPSVAHGVSFRDSLPNPAFVSFNNYVIGNGAGTCFYQAGDNAIDCYLGDIEVGGFRDVFLRFDVKSSTPDGTILNDSIVITATSPIIFGVPNDTTESTTVIARSDLVIEKTSSPLTVYAGEQKRYTVKITNNGPSDALNVVVTDTLPSQVQYMTDTGLCNQNAGIVTCSFGTMATGSSRTFDIITLVNPATTLDLNIHPEGRTITNTAQVASTVVDPFPANNTALAKNFVQQKADLRILKFGKPDDNARAGDLVTYTVIIDNFGPSYAYSVTLKDVLQSSGVFDVVDVASDRPAVCRSIPNGTTYNLPAQPWPVTSAPPPFGVLAPSGQANVNQRYELDCVLTPLLAVVSPVGGPQNPGRWILTVRVRAQQQQDLNNVAYVQSDIAADPDRSNNTAFVKHDLSAVADLSITKTDSPDPVTAGTLLTYTIRITNSGPSDAENVVVYDRLPPGVVVLAAQTSTGATCSTARPARWPTA